MLFPNIHMDLRGRDYYNNICQYGKNIDEIDINNIFQKLFRSWFYEWSISHNLSDSFNLFPPFNIVATQYRSDNMLIK